MTTSFPFAGTPFMTLPPPYDILCKSLCDTSGVILTLYTVPYAPPPIFFAPYNAGLNIVPGCFTRSFAAACASSIGMFASGFERRLFGMRCDSA
ncbi:hypothetical protein PBCV1_a616R [Paramecium bursaria Chlorella virus 1]|uniref:Uncharacterized protein n=1 Tax=Paramecium bursaria Chlorella virus 1 TaxID=10506 RepID=O41098_PBCV1|nr:hypothetical protein PBCV1_a616R [Paramecium bursaria Chlorella virus 1]AAC97027.1 hypothetical protein [Paramecium bursaria Chlorella virus 1]